jgi:hypothetical protein
MKKISGKIAMILILVMLGSMIVGCYFTQWAFNQPSIVTILLLFPCLVLDLLVDTFVVFVWLLSGGKFNGKLASAESEVPLTEEESAILTEKTASLPGEDSAFFIAAIASLPETQRASVLERISSVSEKKLASEVKAMRTLCELPEKDRVFLAEAITSLPEKEWSFLMETAKILTDEEKITLADEVSSTPIKEMSRQLNILRETPSSDWGYREYAAERFLIR